jgi:hypothetical protein
MLHATNTAVHATVTLPYKASRPLMRWQRLVRMLSDYGVLSTKKKISSLVMDDLIAPEIPIRRGLGHRLDRPKHASTDTGVLARTQLPTAVRG